jgi:ankyrin repeat protein
MDEQKQLFVNVMVGGNVGKIREMLENGIEPDFSSGYSPSEIEEIIRMFIEKGAILDKYENSNGQTALMIAAEKLS